MDASHDPRAEPKKHRAIQSALSCRGWTDERKLSLLFDLAQATEDLPGDILEIGSAWGRSLVNFGLASMKRIWSIDPHTGGVTYIKRRVDQNSFGEFVKNLERFNLLERVNILRSTTEGVLEHGLIPETAKFSLVWIDGLHTADGIQKDFELAYKHLSPEGIIVLDDYFNPQFPDYAEMIDQLVAERSIELVRDSVTRLVYFARR